VFPDAYCVTPIVSVRARLMAAVLSIGPDAAVSHRSAADLWGIRRTSTGTIELTVPRWLKQRPGLRIRESVLPADERTVTDGIPVTTVARTLLDLAGLLAPPELERAVERTEALGLTHDVPLKAILDRPPRRRGVAVLRAATAAPTKGATESVLEERFLAFVAVAGLPSPELNAWLKLGDDWIRADCLWREQRLIVELDGRAYHGTRAAFERDRRRDRRALLAGWGTIRVTWAMLDHEATDLERDIRGLMAVRAAA